MSFQIQTERSAIALWKRSGKELPEWSDDVDHRSNRQGSVALEDLVAFLKRVEGVLIGDDYPPGCLVVDAMGHSEDPEPGERYAALFLQGITAALIQDSLLATRKTLKARLSV